MMARAAPIKILPITRPVRPSRSTLRLVWRSPSHSYGGDANNDGSTSTPAASDWGTLTFGTTASSSQISQAYVRFGGDPAIKVSTGALSITNTILDFNFQQNKWGAYVTTATLSHASISGNTFTDNSGYAIYSDFGSFSYLGTTNSFLYPGMVGNAIRVQGGSLTQNTTLISNAVYWLDEGPIDGTYT